MALICAGTVSAASWSRGETGFTPGNLKNNPENKDTKQNESDRRLFFTVWWRKESRRLTWSWRRHWERSHLNEWKPVQREECDGSASRIISTWKRRFEESGVQLWRHEGNTWMRLQVSGFQFWRRIACWLVLNSTSTSFIVEAFQLVSFKFQYGGGERPSVPVWTPVKTKSRHDGWAAKGSDSGCDGLQTL